MIKAEENILYYTENYLSGKLINDLEIFEEVKELYLFHEEVEKFRDILANNISEGAHRCISVYRDGFILNEYTYNICLSCGDFYRDNEHFYLTSKGIEEFKLFKELLIAAKKE